MKRSRGNEAAAPIVPQAKFDGTKERGSIGPFRRAEPCKKKEGGQWKE